MGSSAPSCGRVRMRSSANKCALAVMCWHREMIGINVVPMTLHGQCYGSFGFSDMLHRHFFLIPGVGLSIAADYLPPASLGNAWSLPAAVSLILSTVERRINARAQREMGICNKKAERWCSSPSLLPHLCCSWLPLMQCDEKKQEMS